MLVLYRREKQAGLDEQIDSMEQSEQVDQSPATIPPPAGFEDMPPPNPLPPPGFESMPPPATPMPPPATETSTVDASVPLDFNDSVFSHVVSTNGIQDGASFLSFASQYDADGNGYLRQSELNRAAAEYIAAGHNQPTQNSAFSDEQLLSAGWSQEQIDFARSSGQI